MTINKIFSIIFSILFVILSGNLYCSGCGQWTHKFLEGMTVIFQNHFFYGTYKFHSIQKIMKYLAVKFIL